jgi:hypothetical protein
MVLVVSQAAAAQAAATRERLTALSERLTSLNLGVSEVNALVRSLDERAVKVRVAARGRVWATFGAGCSAALLTTLPTVRPRLRLLSSTRTRLLPPRVRRIPPGLALCSRERCLDLPDRVEAAGG